MKNKKIKSIRGFTLVEMLVVIGLIAILATAVLISVNPARQFKFARDTERKAHLATILNAVGQNIAENQGELICGDTAVQIPPTDAVIRSGGQSNTYDLASCVVPKYLSKLPVDPTDAETNYYTSLSDYNTGYSISKDENGYITVGAKSEIDEQERIELTR